MDPDFEGSHSSGSMKGLYEIIQSSSELQDLQNQVNHNGVNDEAIEDTIQGYINQIDDVFQNQDCVDFGQITKQSGTNTEVILNRLIERYRAKLYQIGVDKEVEYRIFCEKLNLELKSKITKLRDDYNNSATSNKREIERKIFEFKNLIAEGENSMKKAYRNILDNLNKNINLTLQKITATIEFDLMNEKT